MPEKLKNVDELLYSRKTLIVSEIKCRENFSWILNTMYDFNQIKSKQIKQKTVIFINSGIYS